MDLNDFLVYNAKKNDVEDVSNFVLKLGPIYSLNVTVEESCDSAAIVLIRSQKWCGGIYSTVVVAVDITSTLMAFFFNISVEKTSTLFVEINSTLLFNNYSSLLLKKLYISVDLNSALCVVIWHFQLTFIPHYI